MCMLQLMLYFHDQIERIALHLTCLFCFDRYDWSSQLLMSVESTAMPVVQLLEAVACLLNPKLPWNCKVVGYLQHKRIYCLFRGIIIAIPVCSFCFSTLVGSLNKYIIHKWFYFQFRIHACISLFLESAIFMIYLVPYTLDFFITHSMYILLLTTRCC